MLRRSLLSVLIAVGSLAGFAVQSNAASVPAVVTGFATAASCAKPYVAKSGDSWWRIANRAGVTMRKLLAANNARTSTFIRVGATICLPAEATVSSSPGVQPYIPKVGDFSAKHVKMIIAKVFPASQVETALKVAKRESHFLAQAQNLDGCGGSGCYGVFQIHWNAHKSWMLKYKGWKVYKWCKISSRRDLLEPRCNAEIALEMYRRAGNSWGPWGGVPRS